MDFDIDKVIADMISAVQDNVKDNWDAVKSTANQFFERRKKRLALIAGLRINGEISQEKFESRINDEKLIAEAELNAIAVISKAIAQKAINAAMDVLMKAVKVAIDTIL